MNIGRPRQFDENNSLNQAMNQFWQYGYSATSMRDLTACTGQTKSSLYNTFGNKSTIFIKCLTHFKKMLIADLQEQLSKSPSGIQFIHDTLDKVIAEADKSQRMGCMLVNTANELAGNEPDIAKEVELGFDAICSVFAHALVKAQRNQEISNEMDTNAMADFILSGIIGLRTMVKSGASRDRLEQVANRITDVFNCS